MRRGGLFVPQTTPWTPASLPSLIAWYDASNAASITSAAGAVTQWNDLSGNARHLISSSAPLTGVDTINGLNAIKMAGAQKFTCATVSMVLTPVTWLAVVKVASTGAPGAIVGSSVDGGLEWRVEASAGVQTTLRQSTAGIGSSSTAVGTSAVRIGALRVNGGSYSFRRAGAADGSGTAAGTYTGAGTLIVGQQRVAEAITGDLAELVCCNATIAGSDLSSWESYTAAKWAAL